MTGTNGPLPRLMYWPEGVQPVEGERVVTSAEANVFPAGLPVGVVRTNSSGVPEVEPLARLDRLEMVRLFDYGLRGLLPPEASMAKPPGGAAPPSTRIEPPSFAGAGSRCDGGAGRVPGQPMNPDNLPGIRPRPSLGRRLDMAARRGLPGQHASALLLLASAAPLGLPGQPELQQAVGPGLRVLLVALPPGLDAADRGVPAWACSSTC